MNASMVHRGPDDEGRFVDPETGVALGARRLSIIDVAGGHQPAASEDGMVWAVLNGEIYNYPQLRAGLLRRGHVLHSSVDTEALVHLYEDYGDELVHALEGMFAFAIWDRRRQRLLIGRDRFGEKPLFHTEVNGELVFASELDALETGINSRAALNPAAVDEFFLLGYVCGPQTIVRGVKQLPPATVASWTRDAGLSLPRRYWSLPAPLEQLPGSEASMTEEVSDLLVRSVRSRMISDVPLGVFLSGGLDSTLVAAVASQESESPLQTFTIGYSSGEVNETDRAAEMARILGTQHHEHVLTDAEVAVAAPALLSRLDQPLADRALVAMHSLSCFARERVKAVVGGEGADELFGGYGRYRWLDRAEQFPEVVSAAAGRLLEGPLRGIAHRYTDHLADLIGTRSPALSNLNWVTEGRLTSRGLVYGPMLRVEDPNRWLDGEWQAASSVAGAAMTTDVGRWLPDDVLAKADRASMTASLELRTPFLNRELAELAGLVPPQVHLRRGGKAILRSLLEERVPKAVSPRKIGFRVPAADWLRGPLAPTMEEQLRSGRAYSEGWLSPAAGDRLWREHLSGERDWTALLWPALTFGLWLDGRVARRNQATA